MPNLFVLLLMIGIAPLAAGAALLRASPEVSWPRPDPGAILLCALAFNLTFFWQELWLVIPKALTPGLHPVLYHNDHGWTGHAADVGLLQGTGALATLVSGLVFSGALPMARRASVSWRLFLFWMAFQGLYQSLTQLAVGTQLAGNDVGRALGYLHVDAAVKAALLVLAVGAMGLAGGFLARVYPARQPSFPTRTVVLDAAQTTLLAVVVIIPFRLPRDMVEVAFIPLFVNLVGAGWLVLGSATIRRGRESESYARCAVIGPSVALTATLLMFQLVLRHGIAF